MKKILAISLLPLFMGFSGCGLLYKSTHPEPPAISLEKIEPNLINYDVRLYPTWWMIYQDGQLNRLIVKAWQFSPSLEIAGQHIQAAQHLYESAFTTLMPNVSGVAQVDRQQLSQNYMYLPGMPVYTNYGLLGLSLSWSLDIWGKQRKMLEAARDRIAAAEADLSSARLLLTTTITKVYVQYGQAIQLQKLASQEVELRKKRFDIATQRFKKGLIDHALVEQRQLELNAAIASNSQAEFNIKLSQHALAALVAEGPSWGEKLLPPDMASDDILVLPEKIPSNLLARRPDLVALLAEVKASRTQVDAAKLDYLPNIDLLGVIGLQSFGLNQLFALKSREFSVGPSIGLPIFDGGKISAHIAAQEVARNEAITNYHEGVLRALHEVADAISNVKNTQAILKNRIAAQQASQKILDVDLERQRAGMISFEQTESVAIEHLQEERLLIEAKTNASAAKYSLVQALGGGYLQETTTSFEAKFKLLQDWGYLPKPATPHSN